MYIYSVLYTNFQMANRHWMVWFIAIHICTSIEEKYKIIKKLVNSLPLERWYGACVRGLLFAISSSYVCELNLIILFECCSFFFRFFDYYYYYGFVRLNFYHLVIFIDSAKFTSNLLYLVQIIVVTYLPHILRAYMDSVSGFSESLCMNDTFIYRINVNCF